MGIFFTDKKITKAEIEKMVWEAQTLDQAQREMIRQAFPSGTVYLTEFIKTLQKMHQDGRLSRTDYENLKELAEKYYNE